MSTCQVDSCSCRESLPMRGNIGSCIGCNHPVSVHLRETDNEVVKICGIIGLVFYEGW